MTISPEQIAKELCTKILIIEEEHKKDVLRSIRMAWSEGQTVAFLESKTTDHWDVTVERNGEKIVTIESNCLSGREISEEDGRIIRMAANHLIGFVGPEATSQSEEWWKETEHERRI